jgi:hypothetical protein
LTVQVWRPSNFFERVKYRKTVAFVDKKHPHHLFYHEKFIDNTADEFVHTFVHEYVHDVDYHSDGNPMIEMGHGDQSPKGKEKSVPYWLGNRAQELYASAVGRPTTKLSAPALLEHEEGNAAEGEVVVEPQRPLQSFTAEASAG